MKKVLHDILWALNLSCALFYLLILGIGTAALAISALQVERSFGIVLVVVVLLTALVSEFIRTSYHHVYVPIRDLIKNL